LLNEYVGAATGRPYNRYCIVFGRVAIILQHAFLRKPYVGNGYQDCVHNVLLYMKKMHKTGKIRG
jgi:hypothetical protein